MQLHLNVIKLYIGISYRFSFYNGMHKSLFRLKIKAYTSRNKRANGKIEALKFGYTIYYADVRIIIWRQEN